MCCFAECVRFALGKAHTFAVAHIANEVSAHWSGATTL